MEQNAKRHLEEELRSDMEEKEHIIKALQVSVQQCRIAIGFLTSEFLISHKLKDH